MLELLDIGGNAQQRRVIALRPGELEQLARVREPAADAAQRADDGLERLLLLAELLGALRVVPQLRVLELAIDLF